MEYISGKLNVRKTESHKQCLFAASDTVWQNFCGRNLKGSVPKGDKCHFKN